MNTQSQIKKMAPISVTTAELNIKQLSKQFKNIKPDNWLAGRNYSDAFVICVGAGPWRFKRRQNVQRIVLEKLGEQDLSEIKNCNWYPFQWQNNFIEFMADYLRLSHQTMHKFCEYLKEISNSVGSFPARQMLYDASSCPKGAKVLSLFCRDSLKIPSFPIDRHVKRFLLEHNLPTDEYKLVKLCEKVNVDPIIIANGIVKTFGEVKNPDWSINVNRSC